MTSRALSTEKVKSRGRPKLPAESARSEKISGMVTPTELLALNDYSARVGLSVSEVIRASVAGTVSGEVPLGTHTHTGGAVEAGNM